jgi:energy-coupling factor transport system permease protein
VTFDTAATTALGYAAGGSWLHRLSPIPKLAWLLAVVAFAFASFDPVVLGVVVLAGVVVAATAGIVGRLVRALALLAPLSAAILVLQAIAPVACGPACTAAASIGPFTVWVEGVARGLTFVLRILAMEVAAIAVLQTTHPSDLFAALARLRVPYVLNLMIALTLQLVPVLQREVGMVLSAQRARAMRGSGLSALIPSFVPVFASTVERVQQLAISLESRGFGATGPRTSYRRVGFTSLDATIAVAGLVVGTLGIVVSITRPPTAVARSAPVALAIFAVALVVFVGSLVRAVVAIARA